MKIWENRRMKTTLEIPDAIFRRAKAKAAEHRIPLREFVSDAVAEKLTGQSPARERARTKLVGKLRHLRHETTRIKALIEREFERIEPHDPRKSSSS
jgi:hypothetical protein